MSDCFKSFPTGAEILIFAAQEHYQYPRSKASININESHFQDTVLNVQSACDLQRRRFLGVGRLEMNNLLRLLYRSWSSSC